MTDKTPPRNRLKQVRILVWVLVVLAIAGAAFLLLYPRVPVNPPQMVNPAPTKASFGGPFTLVGADGKPFSSSALAGKPYAIYFGYTRCGQICPTTLARLVKLRKESGGEQGINIVFVTIDPANDGPKEVGQYASLFNSPIIGLTGSQAQIALIKRQFGIYAEPEQRDGRMEMNHTATVLLFDNAGKFAATIDSQEPDSDALAKLKRLIA